MADKYPSPCEKCEQCTHVNGCTAWLIRYRYRQKQINAWAKRNTQGHGKSKRNVFCYEHPDIVRKFIREGPCAGCAMEPVCDTPCLGYQAWWDDRMKLMRRKLYGHE